MSRSPARQSHTALRTRIAALATCALLGAACGGGGGGGGDDGTPPASATSGRSRVTLAWEDATGPVVGYRVFVDRGGAGFVLEKEVKQPKVTLKGDPGERARVVVAAYSKAGVIGPGSAPSPQFTFPIPGVVQASASPDPDASVASGVARVASRTWTDPAPGADGEPADGADDAEDLSSADPVDLAGTLVWQSGDQVRLTSPALRTRLAFTRPVADAALAALADFDGDGVGDLLWEAPDGSLRYTPTAALLADATTPPTVDLATLSGGQRLLGAGDLDGDGLADLVVRAAAGSVEGWLTTPGALPDVAWLGVAGTATLAGIGDFDGNGTDDLAWSDGPDGLALWLVDGPAASPSVALSLDGLTVVGIGDFDGDRVAELAVRDAEGAVSLLHPLTAPLLVEGVDFDASAAWHPAGAGDLDRDGTEDLVWIGPDALRVAYLPGEELRFLDPDSGWELVAPLP